jgi:uncharacterized protein YifN (PemK superfamily)
MTALVAEHETDYQFNHQNAWSSSEFIKLVCEYGFELVSTDYGLIKYAFPDVSDIDAHESISNYFYFKKITLED